MRWELFHNTLTGMAVLWGLATFWVLAASFSSVMTPVLFAALGWSPDRRQSTRGRGEAAPSGVLPQCRPCCLNHAWGEAFGPKWRPFPVATWRAAHPSECLPNQGCVDVRDHCSLSPPPASTGLTSSYHSGQAGIPRSPLLCLLGGIRGDNLILACNHKVNVQWPSGDLRITPRPASYLVLVMILFLAEPPRW